MNQQPPQQGGYPQQPPLQQPGTPAADDDGQPKKKPVGCLAGLGCGAFLLFAAVVMTLFSAFHVFIDPHGAISAREAMPFMLLGFVLSFFLLLGLVVSFVFYKKKTSPKA